VRLESLRLARTWGGGGGGSSGYEWTWVFSTGLEPVEGEKMGVALIVEKEETDGKGKGAEISRLLKIGVLRLAI